MKNKIPFTCLCQGKQKMPHRGHLPKTDRYCLHGASTAEIRKQIITHRVIAEDVEAEKETGKFCYSF
jgi:hypothetical protein